MRLWASADALPLGTAKKFLKSEGIVKNSELLTKLSCASAKAKWSTARNHFKYQGDSVRMDYEPGAVVEVRQEIGFHPFTTDGKDQSRETF